MARDGLLAAPSGERWRHFVTTREVENNEEELVKDFKGDFFHY